MQVKASSNELEELPRDIVKMKALTVLDVSDNVIETLPVSTCRMLSLRLLNVADNKIMMFPKVKAHCMSTLIKRRGRPNLRYYTMWNVLVPSKTNRQPA